MHDFCTPIPLAANKRVVANTFVDIRKFSKNMVAVINRRWKGDKRVV